MLKKVSIEHGKLLVLGDFNVHWDNNNAPETKEIKTLLTSNNLKQHVTKSTHREGHILDLVMSREMHELVKSFSVDSVIYFFIMSSHTYQSTQ